MVIKNLRVLSTSYFGDGFAIEKRKRGFKLKNIRWIKLFAEITTVAFMAIVGLFIYQFSPIIACIVWVATFIVALQVLIVIIFSIKLTLWRKK